MTEFSKYFSQVVKCRGLKCVQAAEICGIDTSVMSRWLNGKIIPKNWERLEQAAERLRLTPFETARLKRAYRTQLLGVEQSRNFDEIMEIIQSLEEAQKRQCQHTLQMPFAYEIQFQPAADKGEFLNMENKTDVCRCIQNVLTVLSSRKNGSGLYMKLYNVPETLSLQIKQFCSRIKDGRIEILVSGGSRTEEIKQQKLKRLREMTDLLLAGNRNRISCYSMWNVQESFQQNWMILDDFFLQFSEDMSQGMMTRDGEWTAFFKERFKEMKRRCQLLERSESSMAGFLEEKAAGQKEMAVLEYIPYKSIAVAERILCNRNYPGVPEKNVWADVSICNGLGEMQYLSCFTREGLTEYLQKGEGSGFPGSFTCSWRRRKRYQVLRMMIFLWEQKTAFHYIMLKKDAPNMRGICVKWDSKSGVSLCLGVCPGKGKWEEIKISDTDIRQEFGKFFQCLPESGLAYGEEETLEIMKGLLER